MTNRFRPHCFLIFFAILLAAFLAGCSTLNRTPAPTPTSSATAIPPTPTAPAAEILWVETQTAANDILVKTITDFASANALQYRTLSAITPADITSGTKIVVIDGAPSDLSSLASAAASTQFILLGAGNPGGLKNVSTVQAKPEDEAFMAGYLTMLIANDWRAGGLLANDGPIGSAYTDDFINGAQFVCGKCNPFYSPIVNFPATASEPSISPSTTWTVDAGTLSRDWLSSAFLAPSAALPDVATALSAQNFNVMNGDSNLFFFVSTTAAPQDGSIPWVALLGADYSAGLQEILPQALAGQGNLTASAQIALTDINPDVVTPAKQALFNQTAANLATGNIIPSTIQ